MDKNDILDYVMNTPGNTNRAVLNSMLNNVGGGSEDKQKKLHIIYNNSNETYEIDESEHYLIDEAYSVYNAKTLNIQVFCDDEPLGLLKTEYDNYGGTHNLFVGSCGSIRYEPSAREVPEKIYCKLIIYRIGSDYSVKFFNKDGIDFTINE